MENWRSSADNRIKSVGLGKMPSYQKRGYFKRVFMQFARSGSPKYTEQEARLQRVRRATTLINTILGKDLSTLGKERDFYDSLARDNRKRLSAVVHFASKYGYTITEESKKSNDGEYVSFKGIASLIEKESHQLRISIFELVNQYHDVKDVNEKMKIKNEIINLRNKI